MLCGRNLYDRVEQWVVVESILSDEQQRKWLPPIRSGDWCYGSAVTGTR